MAQGVRIKLGDELHDLPADGCFRIPSHAITEGQVDVQLVHDGVSETIYLDQPVYLLTWRQELILRDPSGADISAQITAVKVDVAGTFDCSIGFRWPPPFDEWSAGGTYDLGALKDLNSGGVGIGSFELTQSNPTYTFSIGVDEPSDKPEGDSITIFLHDDGGGSSYAPASADDSSGGSSGSPASSGDGGMIVGSLLFVGCYIYADDSYADECSNCGSYYNYMGGGVDAYWHPWELGAQVRLDGGDWETSYEGGKYYSVWEGNHVVDVNIAGLAFSEQANVSVIPSVVTLSVPSMTVPAGTADAGTFVVIDGGGAHSTDVHHWEGPFPLNVGIGLPQATLDDDGNITQSGNTTGTYEVVAHMASPHDGTCTVTGVLEVIIKVDFIDDIPDYSLDSNTDSDNFFLREYDDSDDLDSEDLDIYYRILPDGLEVDDVKIKIYRGGTSTLEATLEGEKDGSGEFKTGDNLHTNWTPSVSLADDHPGFYRVQLEVYVAGQTEPICQTSIDDADASLAGWQCPQDCLAIHDLTWKHRPVVHIHEDEIGSPSSIAEFMNNSGDATGPRVKEWTGGSTPTVHPAGTIPASANAFWDLFFDDEVTGGDLSDYNPAQIAVLTTDSGEETVYHSADTEDANNFVFLQFWMFENFSRRPFGILGMPFNPNVQHEGDMEHCQIAVRLSDPADSDLKARWVSPFGATASQHYYAQTLQWDINDGSAPANAHSQERVEHINNRLAVYVALGAHATYLAEDADIEVPDINAHLGTQQQYDGNPEGAYDVSGPADEIEYELLHVDDVLLGDFEGRWGYLLNGNPDSFSNGPPGPPTRAAQDSSGGAVNLRTQPRTIHNAARKTSQAAAMLIP